MFDPENPHLGDGEDEADQAVIKNEEPQLNKLSDITDDIPIVIFAGEDGDTRHEGNALAADKFLVAMSAEGDWITEDDIDDVSGEWTGEDNTRVVRKGGESPATSLPVGPVGKVPTWVGEGKTGVISTPKAAEWTGDDKTGVMKTPDMSAGWTGEEGTRKFNKKEEKNPEEYIEVSWSGESSGPNPILPENIPSKKFDKNKTPESILIEATKDSQAPDWMQQDVSQSASSNAQIAQKSVSQRVNKASDRLRTVEGSAPLDEETMAEMRQRDNGWLEQGRRDELTGKVLGDFLVGGLLGEGGMGLVYRARQISLNRRVALKVLPNTTLSDPVLMERFAAEAHTAGLIISPFVVQVYFAGQSNGYAFFAMEFVGGTDLSKVISESIQSGVPISPERAARYIVQAARGLAEADIHKVIHRDIKPQNLFLTESGTVKLGDFGIARIIGDQHLTLAGNTVGTPAYISPEQGRGDVIDHRSDLYSLGVVYYELLTGSQPFEGTQADQLIYQHNYKEPKAPKVLRPSLPDAWQSVCMRLLMKDPDQRYQHAADLADDLECLIGGSEISVPAYHPKFGTGAEDAMRRHIGRRRWLPWTIAASIIAVIGVALWIGGQILDAKEIARRIESISPLDRTESVPGSARDDLDWLSERLGADDPRVMKWKQKLNNLEILRYSLSRLDTSESFPDITLRNQTANDLITWSSLVGNNDPDTIRWSARLVATQKEIERLRGIVGEVDKADPITVALSDRVRAPLDSVSVLVGADDGDVKRWRLALRLAAEQLITARNTLGENLGKNKVITEMQLKSLDADCKLVGAMAGTTNADYTAWSREIDQRKEDIAHIRLNLSRIDSVDHIKASLQAELAGDLERLTTLVAPDDVQLLGWRAKIKITNDLIIKLRQQLSDVLDRSGGATVSEIYSCEKWLIDYRSLVSRDDRYLDNWERRIIKEKGDITELEKIVERASVNNLAPMSVAEQNKVMGARNELVRRGALSDERIAAIDRRLQDEARRVQELRVIVHANTGYITKPLADALIELEAAVGDSDEDVKPWVASLVEYKDLRRRLEVLDRRVPILEEGILAIVEAYGVKVGPTDADYIRWKKKATQVDDIKKSLEWVSRPMVPPLGASEAIAKLEEIGSAQDPLAIKGRVKLSRIKELSGICVSLNDSFIPLPIASDALTELGKLQGENNPQWQTWDKRRRVLEGPMRPSWALGWGRDEKGRWADLVVGNERQRVRFIPGGIGTLGSPVDEIGRDPIRDEDETAPHVMKLKSFWMADSECTQGIYAAVTGMQPAQHPGSDRPVESISRADAQHFCSLLLGRAAGMEARLPTETEWEYACRASTTGAYSGPQGSIPLERLSEVAWFGRTDAPRPVRLLQPNALGIYDMHGNVWEWTSDNYVATGSGSYNSSGIVRGGSWNDRPSLLRSANRVALDSEKSSATVGFRFAISVVWPIEEEAPE